MAGGGAVGSAAAEAEAPVPPTKKPVMVDPNNVMAILTPELKAEMAGLWELKLQCDDVLAAIAAKDNVVSEFASMGFYVRTFTPFERHGASHLFHAQS